MLWVEHCEERYDAIACPKIHSGYYDPVEVEKQFRGQRDRYDLLVDECVRAYHVRGKDAAVEWSVLRPRHRRVLGMILEAFRTRDPVSQKAMTEYRRTPGQSFDPGSDGDVARVIMTDLRRKLNGVLTDAVKADKGFRRVNVRGQIPYCWIRSSNRSSLLLD